MKIGDLVKYVGDDWRDPPILKAGLVTAFDKDNDPIVLFVGDEPDYEGWEPRGSPFYKEDIEVINECW